MSIYICQHFLTNVSVLAAMASICHQFKCERAYVQSNKRVVGI